MARGNKRFNPLKLTKQVGKVQTRLESLAERSSQSANDVLYQAARKILDRAMEYAPFETNSLNNRANWRVFKKRDGINRRYTYTIRLRPNVRRKDKRRSLISSYAAYMHDNEYRARLGAKRDGGRGNIPNGAGDYVGRLYLTRATNHYRLITLQNLRKAVAKELR